MSLLGAIDWATTWPLFLLAGLVVVYIIYMLVARKKSDTNTANMLDSLKKGDKIVTNSGIYGEIVSISETTLGKTVLLKTGEGKNVSYMSVNAVVILGKDEKQPVVLDKDGNVVEPKPVQPAGAEVAKTEPKPETKVEEKPVEKAETPVAKQEVKAAVKKTPAPSSKKTAK